MAITKQELLNNRLYDNQQKIVKRLQDEKEVKPIVHQIPAGFRIHETLATVEDLTDAIYNWLRATRAFSSVEICFAENKSLLNLQKRIVHTYSSNNPKEEWEISPDGRKALAELLARHILRHKPVSITATKDNVSIQVDVEDKFGPTKTITAEDIETMRTLAQEIVAEATEAGIDPETIELPQYQVGDKIIAENWKPHLVFVPKPKSGGYGK